MDIKKIVKVTTTKVGRYGKGLGKGKIYLENEKFKE